MENLHLWGAQPKRAKQKMDKVLESMIRAGKRSMNVKEKKKKKKEEDSSDSYGNYFIFF